MKKRILPKKFDEIIEEDIKGFTLTPKWQRYLRMKRPTYKSVFNLFDYRVDKTDSWWQNNPASWEDRDLKGCEPVEYLKNKGWLELEHSSRLVLTNGQYVIKLGLCGNSIAQNYLEAMAYRRLAKIKSRPKELGIPKFINYHKKYYWILTQYIDSHKDAEHIDLDKKIDKIIESNSVKKFFNKFHCEDIYAHNFVYGKDKRLYLIDLGFYRWSEFEDGGKVVE